MRVHGAAGGVVSVAPHASLATPEIPGVLHFAHVQYKQALKLFSFPKQTPKQSDVSLETGQMSSVGTGQMSAVETGQMSAVETGQMSAAETGQMSAVETRQMSTM